MGVESGRKTTIWVSVELREELRKIGRMGETYEQVIWRLLEFWWSRGPDLNRGPADLQSAAAPRLGYRGTLQPSPHDVVIDDGFINFSITNFAFAKFDQGLCIISETVVFRGFSIKAIS